MTTAAQTGAQHEVTVPDIGDFHDVPVIEVHVAPGDVVATTIRWSPWSRTRRRWTSLRRGRPGRRVTGLGRRSGGRREPDPQPRGRRPGRGRRGPSTDEAGPGRRSRPAGRMRPPAVAETAAAAASSAARPAAAPSANGSAAPPRTDRAARRTERPAAGPRARGRPGRDRRDRPEGTDHQGGPAGRRPRSRDDSRAAGVLRLRHPRDPGAGLLASSGRSRRCRCRGSRRCRARTCTGPG